MTIWRRMRDQQFPKPIRFGGHKSPRYWKREHVEVWIAQREAMEMKKHTLHRIDETFVKASSIKP